MYDRGGIHLDDQIIGTDRAGQRVIALYATVQLPFVEGFRLLHIRHSLIIPLFL
jgi:hypothetical protein